jgi:hypothetical protein
LLDCRLLLKARRGERRDRRRRRVYPAKSHLSKAALLDCRLKLRRVEKRGRRRSP